MEVLLADKRFLRAQVRNPRLEVQWASSFDAVLALSRLDKALQWLTYVAMIHCFYCSQDCTQESEQPHVRWMLPLVVLAWEIFWETTLANRTKVIVVWN